MVVFVTKRELEDEDLKTHIAQRVRGRRFENTYCSR